MHTVETTAGVEIFTIIDDDWAIEIALFCAIHFKVYPIPLTKPENDITNGEVFVIKLLYHWSKVVPGLVDWLANCWLATSVSDIELDEQKSAHNKIIGVVFDGGVKVNWRVFWRSEGIVVVDAATNCEAIKVDEFIVAGVPEIVYENWVFIKL